MPLASHRLGRETAGTFLDQQLTLGVSPPGPAAPEKPPLKFSNLPPPPPPPGRETARPFPQQPPAPFLFFNFGGEFFLPPPAESTAMTDAAQAFHGFRFLA